MDNFLDKILNEEEKDEKRLKIFFKIFPIIIILILISLFIVACYNYFLQLKKTRNQKIGDVIVQLSLDAVTDNTLINNTLSDTLINSSKSKLFELVSLKGLSQKMNLKNASNFIVLNKILNSENYCEITKAYARILYINSVLNLEVLDQQQEKKLIECFEYFDKESFVFYEMATLLKSLFYLKNNNFSLAKLYALKIINSSSISSILKEEAKAIINIISIKTEDRK